MSKYGILVVIVLGLLAFTPGRDCGGCARR